MAVLLRVAILEGKGIAIPLPKYEKAGLMLAIAILRTQMVD